MVETAQVNVRVPPEARDAILRLATLLREDPGALEALERFLEDMPPPSDLATQFREFEESVARALEAMARRIELLEGRSNGKTR